MNLAPVKETKNKIIWKSSCSSCSFNEKTINNLKESRLENEKREEERKKRLDDYRDRFCSEEKGKEAFEYIEALKIAPIIYEEAVRKYDSLAYQKVSQLKKVTILELEKLLSETLEQEKYIKLSMDKPEMHTHIIAPISFQDAASRTKDDSISQASKIIKNLLEKLAPCGSI